MADLSNCPFCDGVMEPFGPDQFNHPRNNCWLSSVGVVRKEFAAWNRRTAPPSPVADDGLQPLLKLSDDFVVISLDCNDIAVDGAQTTATLIKDGKLTEAGRAAQAALTTKKESR